MRNPMLVAVIAAASLCLPRIPHAQDAADPFYAKPFVVIAPYDPGGPIDIEGRMYTKKASELTRQQFVLDYKTGATTRIGVSHVARAVADGHTLLIHNTTFTALPALYKNLAFDTIKDFAPISQMSKKVTLLVTGPNFPAKTFVEFIAYAKANPGKVNYGTLGAGGTSHLIGAWLEIAANIKVTFIPYKGTGPQLLDIASGRLDVTQSALSAVSPFIKSGKLRPLVSTDDRRSALLADLPTIAEYLPGVGYQNWTGFLAPRATPSAAVGKLAELFARVAREPDIVGAAEAQGNVMVGSSPAQFAQMIVEDVARWQKLAQAVGIVLEE